MLSTYERTPSGIIYKAAEQLEAPALDLLTFIFDSPHTDAHATSVLHASADDPRLSLTLVQQVALLQQLAFHLRSAYGLGARGPSRDVALAVCAGHWQLPTLFYATVCAGAIFTSASPAATVPELTAQLCQVDARLVYCTPETRPVAVRAAAAAGLPADRVLMLGPGRAGWPGGGLELLVQGGDDAAAAPQPVRLDERQVLPWSRVTDRAALEDSIVCILFSSGTTGTPKAVRLSHANLVSEAFLTLTPLRAHTRAHEPGHEHRTLAHLPAAHIAGVQGYFVNAAFFGGTVFWMTRFEWERFLEHNKRFRITTFFTVPPIYLLIAKSPLVTDQFDTLEFAISGAAPLGKELQRAAKRRMGRGKTHLSQTWGLSETTGSVTIMPRGIEDETGSVSALVPSCLARIVDDEHRDVEPGQSGELWVKGPMVVKGYYKNDKATQDAFVDGWLRTGDIGLFKDGLFYIVDRKKVCFRLARSEDAD